MGINVTIKYYYKQWDVWILNKSISNDLGIFKSKNHPNNNILALFDSKLISISNTSTISHE